MRHVGPGFQKKNGFHTWPTNIITSRILKKSVEKFDIFSAND
jgi:hypothetical protein